MTFLRSLTPPIMGLFLLAAPVWAAPIPGVTITFNDLSESPITTFSPSDQTRASGGGCSSLFGVAEFCEVSLASPVGAVSVNTFALTIADPDGLTISDEVGAGFVFGGLIVDFISDEDETSGLGLCPLPAGCDLVETGGLQLAGTLTWLDAQGNTLAIDTIQFCSDVESVSSTCSTTSVPEPGTLLLLGSGLAGLAGLIWRRQRRT